MTNTTNESLKHFSLGALFEMICREEKRVPIDINRIKMINTEINQRSKMRKKKTK